MKNIKQFFFFFLNENPIQLGHEIGGKLSDFPNRKKSVIDMDYYVWNKLLNLQI